MRTTMARTLTLLAAAPLLVGCIADRSATPSQQRRSSDTGAVKPFTPPDPITVRPAAPRQPEGEVLRPEAFGAVGDGFADDTGALQAALDAAAEVDGQVVLAGRSTYLMTSSIELPSGARLTGQGPSSVLQFTWRHNDADHDGFYLGNRDQTEIGNTDITLERFAIRGAAAGLPVGPKAILEEPNVPAIRLRLVDRFRIAEMDIGFAPGISLIHQGCSNGAIVENRIHHSGRDGINSTWHHRNMHDILIADNIITNVGDDGVAVVGAPGQTPNKQRLPHGVLVKDNVIRGWRANPNGLALGRGISVLAATRVRLEGNLIDRTHSAGILVAPSTRGFSTDPDTGLPWRSSEIQITGNRVVEAGGNAVGSSRLVEEPNEGGILVKSSDRVSLWDNRVVRPVGGTVVLYDCRRCVSRGDG